MKKHISESCPIVHLKPHNIQGISHYFCHVLSAPSVILGFFKFEHICHDFIWVSLVAYQVENSTDICDYVVYGMKESGINLYM